MSFIKGQRVRMLIETMGIGNDDEEHTHPVGTLGVVDSVEYDRRIYHVEIGEGDKLINNSFDFGQEADAAMEPVAPGPRVHAKPGAFSSVLGLSVLLTNSEGVAIGQLRLCGVEGGRAEWEAMAVRIAHAINMGQAERQVHHVKKDTTYDVLPEVLFQVSERQDLFGIPKGRIVQDGDPITVYRNPNGMHFARFPDEVVSPRFEDV